MTPAILLSNSSLIVLPHKDCKDEVIICFTTMKSVSLMPWNLHLSNFTLLTTESLTKISTLRLHHRLFSKLRVKACHFLWLQMTKTAAIRKTWVICQREICILLLISFSHICKTAINKKLLKFLEKTSKKSKPKNTLNEIEKNIDF